MKVRLSATELVRRLSAVLGRVQYGGDSFVVERHGTPIARLLPVAGNRGASLRDAVAAWTAAAPPDATFADDLERVSGADRAPANPWASSSTRARS